MSGPGATPVFVDTGPLYARFDEADQYHERAVATFEAIADGELVFRPLSVSSHVLAEFATLAVQGGGADEAARAVRRVRESALFTVVQPSERELDAACRAMATDDDQSITLVDHLTAVVADERDVEHVYTFDSDFRTLGMTLVSPETDDIDRPGE